MLLALLALPWLREDGRKHLIQRWAKTTLRILHVRISVSGNVPQPAAMLLANHISWLDVWLLSALLPVRFVAKSEVRSWPVIGWLSTKVGVVFIQRARRKDTARVANASTQVLLNGDTLCVFPEGTTTDGTCMLPFKSGLVQAAIDSKVQIIPVAIRYFLAGGSANTSVAFIGEMTLWDSLLQILVQSEINAEVTFLQPLETQTQSRQVLALDAQNQIAKQLHLPQHAVLETLGDLQDEVQ